MTYYNECMINAEKGLDYLIRYLDNQSNLIYTREIEKGCGKYGDDLTCIEVEILDENEGTNFIRSFEFDDKGKFIE